MKKITEFTAEKLEVKKLLEVRGGTGTFTGDIDIIPDFDLDFDLGAGCTTNMCKRKACKKKACQSNA